MTFPRVCEGKFPRFRGGRNRRGGGADVSATSNADGMGVGAARFGDGSGVRSGIER